MLEELLTMAVITEDEVELPAVSYALQEKVCVPLAIVVVSHWIV